MWWDKQGGREDGKVTLIVFGTAWFVYFLFNQTFHFLSNKYSKWLCASDTRAMASAVAQDAERLKEKNYVNQIDQGACMRRKKCLPSPSWKKKNPARSTCRAAWGSYADVGHRHPETGLDVYRVKNVQT